MKIEIEADKVNLSLTHKEFKTLQTMIKFVDTEWIEPSSSTESTNIQNTITKIKLS